MDMNELESLILAGVDDKTMGMKYAQGYGRCVGLLWGMIQEMSPQEQEALRAKLKRFYEQETVEESTT